MDLEGKNAGSTSSTEGAVGPAFWSLGDRPENARDRAGVRPSLFTVALAPYVPRSC